MKVEESLNVTFDETPPPPKTSPLEDDDLVKEEAIEINKTRPLVPSANPRIFSVTFNIPTFSVLKRYNGIKFTQDPKSAKASKGLESLSLQEWNYTWEHELELKEPET
ncbi:hypothetical protein Tco_0469226 [Tanacetum coccineum]